MLERVFLYYIVLLLPCSNSSLFYEYSNSTAAYDQQNRIESPDLSIPFFLLWIWICFLSEGQISWVYIVHCQSPANKKCGGRQG